MTGDKKRNRPAREVTWSTKQPVSRRRGPEDIMTKPEKLSPTAAVASTEDELWGLFFTDEMLNKIVQYTNDSITEDIENLRYTAERMKLSPYIKLVDKVRYPVPLINHLFTKSPTLTPFPSHTIFSLL
jgi:hypothetical protein